VTRAFVAYPAKPAEIGDVIRRAAEAQSERPSLELRVWERPDLAGYEIIHPIVDAIRNAEVVAADITTFNFNVTYELGFAIGLGKRVVPLTNSSFMFDLNLCQKIGIFDTLIREQYSGYLDLLDILSAARLGQRIATDFPPDPLPLYTVLPTIKIDEFAQLVIRARKAGLWSRTFDPTEQPRLGATEAVRAVAASYGVVVPLLAPQMAEAEAHNIRAAFVAGVASALEKPLLILKKGDWSAPSDVCDQVSSFNSESGLAASFEPFATRVHDAKFAAQPKAFSNTRIGLSRLSLGDPAAENEESQLSNYFLERGEFQQVVDGRANIVVGRKGSGKTAMWVRARDYLRGDRSKIVLPLSPEGYQLRKLKDIVLDCLSSGSKDFLLKAFWEYVILLEICANMLDKDQEVHKRNHLLFEPYQRLLAYFREEPVTKGLDFSDRLTKLIEKIGEKYQEQFGHEKEERPLTHPQMANMIYSTTLAELRAEIEKYAAKKGEVHVLFDNIDKGWNASGLEEADLIMIRTLIDAGKTLKNDFCRAKITFHFTVFLRNDIYDMLLSATPDRGKDHKALVDWTDADLLKQILRKRIIYNESYGKDSIDILWHQICVPLVDGQDSLDFLVNRSLMRPRYLLRLVNHCLGNAVNFGRNRIDEDDIYKGLSLYSSDILTEIDLEIRDVLPWSSDTLYIFLGEPKQLQLSAIKRLFHECFQDEIQENTIVTLLLWHGVVGLVRPGQEVTYIYDVNYDLRRLAGLIDKTTAGDPLMQINPALWPGLEMK